MVGLSVVVPWLGFRSRHFLCQGTTKEDRILCGKLVSSYFSDRLFLVGDFSV